MSDQHLSIDGPHGDSYTRSVADAVADAVRVLCHATIPGQRGITTPATVYAILGSLHAAANGLDQLLRQLDQTLAAQHHAGQLGEHRPDGGPGDPADSVKAAQGELLTARQRSAQLSDALRRAHAAIASVHMRPDDDTP